MEGRRRAAIAAAVIGAVAIAAIVFASRAASEHVPCGPGFERAGPRCCPSGATANADGTCSSAGVCAAPLVGSPFGCTSDGAQIIAVPATTVLVGPSDWEAEGRVPPRTVSVAAFRIDRWEVAVAHACASPVFASEDLCRTRDGARAVYGVTLEQARAYCAGKGGRLPTEDEWLAAAGGDRPRRYPWGDTGAVCRRAAWGLESGPCAEGAHGPDSVGAHPDGRTPLGIEDLAGNVAEWVEVDGGAAVRGGSWRTRLATDLRTWPRREVSPSIKDPTIGFRCAYGGVP